ncbi:MAG: nitrogen fixation protein [Methylococcales bacterium]
MASGNRVLCPSAPADWEGSQVIGIMTGTVDEPKLAYMDKPQPVTAQLLDLAKPVNPGEVFRFSAPCANTGCAHFMAEESKCRFAEKVVRFAPVVVEQLPACSIRPECRWWQQEGKAACFRCPQMVTTDLKPSAEMRMAADPEYA